MGTYSFNTVVQNRSIPWLIVIRGSTDCFLAVCRGISSLEIHPESVFYVYTWKITQTGGTGNLGVWDGIVQVSASYSQVRWKDCISGFKGVDMEASVSPLADPRNRLLFCEFLSVSGGTGSLYFRNLGIILILEELLPLKFTQSKIIYLIQFTVVK